MQVQARLYLFSVGQRGGRLFPERQPPVLGENVQAPAKGADPRTAGRIAAPSSNFFPQKAFPAEGRGSRSKRGLLRRLTTESGRCSRGNRELPSAQVARDSDPSVKLGRLLGMRGRKPTVAPR
jgi:hypothetical protein